MADPRTPDYYKRLNEFRRFEKVVFDTTDKTSAQTREAARASLSTGLAPYSGQWGEKEAAHLLKRTLFGCTRSEINNLASMSPQAAVDLLLTPEETPPHPVNNYASFVNSIDRTEDVEEGEPWVFAKHVDNLSFARQMSLKGWWIQNMIRQTTSIHQKLMLFWHALLPTQIFDAGLPIISYQYVQLLHKYTLGNYKSLIREITLNPAMLLFLNGASNVKEAPDENYARELQELFTIGKGPDANFTENDVYEAARVLTGWTVSWESIINGPSPRYIFNYYNHDTGDKHFSAFYRNRTISGREGNQGQDETYELINMIFDNDETALYICRRLYNFFVYHQIDAQTEENVIAPLATIFRENNFEILPVIRALLLSEHFYDIANRGAYIKSPADHLIGLIRNMNVTIPEQLDENYELLQDIYWLMGTVGMEIGDPPSVSGWQAWYQQPGYDRIWINTDTITKRAQWQDILIYQRGDIISFVYSLNNPSDPNELIRESALVLHGIEIDDEVSNGLKDTLLSGQQTDAYWTIAWDQYVNEPENEEYRLTVESRLRSMYRSMLQLSEFQLF